MRPCRLLQKRFHNNAAVRRVLLSYSFSMAFRVINGFFVTDFSSGSDGVLEFIRVPEIRVFELGVHSSSTRNSGFRAPQIEQACSSFPPKFFLCLESFYVRSAHSTTGKLFGDSTHH